MILKQPSKFSFPPTAVIAKSAAINWLCAFDILGPSVVHTTFTSVINKVSLQANPTLELPTMVGMTADPTLQNNRPPVVTAPIATDVVPPDDLFNNDDVD